MKPVKSLCLFICLLIMLTGSAYSETKKIENIFDTQDGEIKIESISWKLDMKESKVTFNGDVRLDGFKVEGDDITMSCQKLEIYFKNIGKNTSIKTDKYDIEKIIATESVVVEQPASSGYAKAEKAEYNIESEEIILTGSPYIKYFKDGKNYKFDAPVKLTIDLKEESITADGTKEDKSTIKRAGKDER